MASSVTAAPPMVLPRGPGRLVAFQGAAADVLPFHPRQRGEHGEHDPGRVVRALQLAGQELQPDAGGPQLLGQRRQFQAPAEPLVLVHDQGDRDPGRAQLPGQRRGPVELGTGDGAGGDLLGEDPRDAGGPQRAYPIRTCPAGTAPGTAGRGSSAQAEPGLRSAGTGTLRALARRGTSRNRAVWYWAATLPLPVRHGDPAGAAQDDIGQSAASTCRKSSSLIRRSFHGGVSPVQPYGTTYETAIALHGRQEAGCFTGPRL